MKRDQIPDNDPRGGDATPSPSRRAGRRPVWESGNLLGGVVYFYRIFRRELGKRLHVYAALCLIGSLAESLAITGFVPLLGGSGAEKGSSAIDRFFIRVLEFLHLPAGFRGMLLLIAMLGVTRVVVSFLQAVCRGWLSSGLEKDLRSQFAKLIERAQYKYVASQSVGYFSNIFSVEIPKKVASLNKLTEVIAGMIFTGTFLVSAFLLDWRITLAAVVIGGIGLLVLRKPAAKIQAISRKTTLANGQMQSLVLQFLDFYKYLKSTASAAVVRSRVAGEFENLRKLTFQNQLVVEFLGLLAQLALLVSMLGLLFFLVEVEGVELAAVLVLAMLFYKALQQMVAVQNKWQVFCAVSGSVTLVTDTKANLEREVEAQGGIEAGDFSRAIELEKVFFSYGETDVLKGVSLRICKNQTIGIVGESGAGKSTLIDLITGVIKPTTGTITFDGKPYAELDATSLRSQIGLVIQEPVVFNDTIAANISMWSHHDAARSEDLHRAASMSHAAEFIDRFELGFDTVVGDRGARLSGGQRQRIAIAREIYKQSPIVIFDEATSSLDSSTETAVQEGIVALAGERTVIIVAHRLSTLRHCDVIYVLADGQLVEQGSWNELREKGGTFAMMCRQQGIAGRG